MWYSVADPFVNEEWTPKMDTRLRSARHIPTRAWCPFWCPFFGQNGEIWWISETLETFAVSCK